jgi:hypothetical protein
MIATPVTIKTAACATVVLALALLVPLNAAADGGEATGTARGLSANASMKTAPMKANGSGVIVRYRIDGTPEIGVAVPVVLTFDGVTERGGALLRLTTEGGLALGNVAETRTLPTGEETTLTINVTPTVAGIGYLHVFTTQYSAISATSIPVQIGKTPSALPNAGDLKQTPGGDKVRSIQVK